jgi:hypothetical protein
MSHRRHVNDGIKFFVPKHLFCRALSDVNTVHDNALRRVWPRALVDTEDRVTLFEKASSDKAARKTRNSGE